MTRDEVKRLLATISAYYPTFKVEDKTMMINAWYEILKEFDAVSIGIALKRYITTNKTAFAPSIGQLLDMLTKDDKGNEVNAWGLVMDAIRDSTYHSEERFKELPADIQRVIGSPRQLSAWATDAGFNEAVVQSNFMRAYRTVKEQIADEKKIPPSIRALIEQGQRIGIESG